MNSGISRTKLAVGGTALTVVALGIVAAPAYAYPPGTKLEVAVSDPFVKAGTPVTATATHVQPGCKVYGTISGSGWSGAQSTVLYAPNGTASITFAAPSKPGFYKITATSFGKGCAKESDITYLVVKKAKVHVPPKWWHGKPWRGGVSGFPKGAPVTFTVFKGGKAVGTVTKTCDGNGDASFVGTVNSAGSYTVTATSGAVSETSTVTVH